MKMNKKTLRILEIVTASLFALFALSVAYNMISFIIKYYTDWTMIITLFYIASYALISIGLFTKKKILNIIGVGLYIVAFLTEALYYGNFTISYLIELSLYALLLVLNVLCLKDKKPDSNTKIIFLVALAILAILNFIIPILRYGFGFIDIMVILYDISIILLCIVTYFHYIQGKDEEKKKENKQVEIPVDHSINSIAGCAEKLQRIKQLLDTDAISKSEFDKLKKEIIDKFKNI